MGRSTSRARISPTIARLIPLLAALLVSRGCRSETCVPGSTQPCPCPGGSQGAQTCSGDGSAWGPCGCAAAAAPTVPAVHACPRCNGKGNITTSEQKPLPNKVVQCELAGTGLFGLGRDRVAHVSVRNDADKSGTFVVRVSGKYPGGGQIEHGKDDHVFIEAHQTAKRNLQFTPKDGLQGVACAAEAPRVVVETQQVCPVCRGTGNAP